jgi:hypothetical protein
LPFGAIELAKRNFIWNIANHAALQENNQPQEGISAVADRPSTMHYEYPFWRFVTKAENSFNARKQAARFAGLGFSR